MEPEATNQAVQAGGVILSFLVVYGVWVLAIALVILIFIYMAVAFRRKEPPHQP